jgi:putative sporulation protein YtaF
MACSLTPALSEDDGFPGDMPMRKFDLLPILLLAISSNGDNVVVGVACGLDRISVPFTSNLLIAVVTGICTVVCMFAGHGIGSMMAPRVASSIGGAIIAAIGGWFIVQSVQSGRQRSDGPGGECSAVDRQAGVLRRLMSVLDNPAGADSNQSRRIELKEGWLLALALSLNNTVNGVAAGMMGMNPVLLTMAVMLCSMVMLSAGLAAGSQLSRRWLSGFSGVLSGVMLMLLGLYELHV